MRLKVLLIGFLLLVIGIFVIFANYMEMVTKSIYTQIKSNVKNPGDFAPLRKVILFFTG